MTGPPAGVAPGAGSAMMGVAATKCTGAGGEAHWHQQERLLPGRRDSYRLLLAGSAETRI
ncbi:MAG: hypothetical protein ACYDB7_09370 [Mycobacteriales bacterium]